MSARSGNRTAVRDALRVRRGRQTATSRKGAARKGAARKVPWMWLWSFRILMTGLVIIAAASAVQSVPDRANANRYHSAPLCASSRDSSGCRLVQPAVVERVTVIHARSTSTDVVLRITTSGVGSAQSGPPPSTTDAVGFNDDFSHQFASGQRVTVTLWNRQVAGVSGADGSIWEVNGGPDFSAGADAEGIVGLTIMCMVPMRIAAWKKHGRLIGRTRMILTDAALAALYIAVCVLTELRLTVPTAWTAGATLVALVAATFWPRLVLRRRAVRSQRTAGLAANV